MSHAIVFSTSEKYVSCKRTLRSKNKNLDTATFWLERFQLELQPFYPQRNAQWLHYGLAAEIICKPEESFTISEAINIDSFLALRTRASLENIDVNIVALQERRKKLLIADMDSTIITSESLDQLAQLAGVGGAVEAITDRSIAGEIDFSEALIDRVKLLAGKPVELLEALLDKVVLNDGAVSLVQTMRANDSKCYLVSGGFDFLLGYVSRLCGFHGYHGNHMLIKENVITGEVLRPILDRKAKAEYLIEYCTRLGIDISATASIGDGANDLEMLSHSGMGVAFRGQKLLLDTIPLQLNYTNLLGLLYLQGYSAEEFVGT
ncbi:phosphoserine phosphatase SerB [Alphaproteobacteria bacterium]|jgi:phosphoserine phosphatase|nr:phosphoserine phosphatase SerB [Alphaproteobacteria bacterium]